MYAGQSFRLMALAVGTLRHASLSDLASMDQQQAERCCSHMDLLGLVVLSNHLHPASQKTITELQERCTLPLPVRSLYSMISCHRLSACLQCSSKPARIRLIKRCLQSSSDSRRQMIQAYTTVDSCHCITLYQSAGCCTEATDKAQMLLSSIAQLQ